MSKLGINSNILKIIAIIAVIFDHIGVYFYNTFNPITVVYLRIIGRIAMPIFAFLIVQGFFHTKDLAKYVKRLFISGIITQIIIYIMYTINNFVFPEYVVLKDVLSINILISFAISLIILKTIDNLIIKIEKKEKIEKQDILLIIVSIMLLSLYFITDFDYSYMLIIYIIMLYVVHKVMIEKNAIKDKYISKFVYNMFNLLSLLTFVIIYNSEIEYFAVLAIIFIALYNNERGKDSKTIRRLFYLFYPLQHFLLYLTAMISIV